QPDAVEVLRRRAAHVHRVLGEVHVAAGGHAQGGRGFDVGGLEHQLDLEAAGHLGQRLLGGDRGGHGGDSDEGGGRVHGGGPFGRGNGRRRSCPSPYRPAP